MTTSARIERIEQAADALITRHDSTRAAVDLSTYKGRILDFVREVLRFTNLTAAQREHLEAVQNNSRVAAYGANGCGKTFDDALIAFYMIYVEHALVVATSAKESQLRDQYMRDVAKIFHRARTPDGAPLAGELFTMKLVRPAFPDTGLYCMAASTTDNLRAYHAPRMLVQLQEAQGLPDFAFEAAEMMAVGAHDRITLTGNCTTPHGTFHKRCESPSWVAVRFNSEDHPNVLTGTIVIPGGPTRESIAQRAADYGRDSAFFIASVQGIFPSEGLEGLIKFEWIERAFQRHEQGTLTDTAWTYCPPGAVDPERPRSSLQVMRTGYSPLLSVDPARYGADSTAVAIARGPVIERIVVWRNASTVESAERVLRLRAECWTNPDVAPPRIIIDANGIGAGVLDTVRARGASAMEYNGANKPIDRKRYLNRRAEDFLRLRWLLEHDKIALPRDEDLAEELLALEYTSTPSGLMQLIAKDDIKQRIGRSPDKADCVCQAFAVTMPPPGARAVIGTYRV